MNRTVKLLTETLPKGQGFVCDNLCLLVLVGSRLYGTNKPESDFDYLGVTLPRMSQVLGLERFEQYERVFNDHPSFNDKKVEFKIYDFRKYIKLAMGANPNILEPLFAPEKNVVWKNGIGQSLIDNRDMFLSLKCYHTFCGYANSQKNKLLTKARNMTGRTELVEKYGFDTKFLMHLFRLYYEVIELLKEGELNLPLSQNKKLLDIRDGLMYNKTELEKALEDARELERVVTSLYATSKLPHKPDYHMIEKYQINILYNHFFAGEF